LIHNDADPRGDSAMWAFQSRARQPDGTLATITIPLRDHIEALKADEWENWDIANAVLRGGKWIDSENDKLHPSGVPEELVPINDRAVFNTLPEYEMAVEYLKLSMQNPINED
jgi:hypothetical protein